MICVTVRNRAWAVEIWPRVCEGLDPQACFGATELPGEWWAEISENDVTLGMTWVRPWLPGVVGQSRAMLPEYRHTHRSAEMRRPVFDAIWAAYPDAKTIIGVAYSTNPVSVANLNKTFLRIGYIPIGDVSLKIYLLEMRP